MWAVLRNHRLGGLKSRRQHSIGPFIVDFFCVERSVVVEIDGEYHDYTEEADKRRQRYLERQGCEVLRYTNEDVLEHFEAVVISLRKTLSLPPSP